MTYSEVMELLNDADRDDFVYNDQLGTYTYKRDLNIRIEHRRDEDKVYQWEVVPEWAKQNHHPGLVAKTFYIFYGNSFVKNFCLGEVDEFRAMLPMPYPGTKEVSLEDYRLASLVNDHPDYFEMHMHMSGLTVKQAA